MGRDHLTVDLAGEVGRMWRHPTFEKVHPCINGSRRIVQVGPDHVVVSFQLGGDARDPHQHDWHGATWDRAEFEQHWEPI